MGVETDFGTYLVGRGLLTDAAWARVQDVLLEARQGLAATLTGLGLLSEKDLAFALSKHYDLPFANPQDWPLEPLALVDLNPTFLSHYYILPVTDHGDHVEAILGDPTNDYAVRALAFATGKEVTAKIATLREVETAINRLYFGDSGPSDELSEIEDLANDVDRLKELAADAPVIRFVDRMIDDALSKRASDIHVEPIEGRLQIRFRVDGILIEMNGPSRDMTAAVVSRLKIMSGLDIAERRLPQDGRMRVRAHGKEIDFRVSTAPTAQGEAVVLRLLDRGAVVLDFDSLGFDDIVKTPFRAALRQPDGIVLVTGPTGSGKTTTLYTGLSELNQPENKILTVEDPVEYVIEGLGQVQVDNRIGRTFAGTLRAFLRQDPDIIMVGEIRDEETAGIAIQASLTGHLVLSTLHTNSAAAAIARLIDMGVEDYLLASTLRIVMAQRLVRTLCNSCKAPEMPAPELLRDLGLPPETEPYYVARGCDDCHGSGYLGRTMIAEVLEVTRAVEKAIIERRTGADIEELARKGGMRTLFEHGLQKVREGKTSLTEVLRVTRERS